VDTQALCHEQDLADTLAHWMKHYPDCQLFGFVDGTVESGLLEQFFLLEPEADYWPLFLGTEYEPCLPASPYLIRLDQVNGEFMADWGNSVQQRMVWFLSSVPAAQQNEYWHSLMQAITPDGNTALFRFWNGEILAGYLLACSTEERQQLLKPAQIIFAPHQQRQWRAYQLEAADRFSDADFSPVDPWWQIQPHHLQYFDKAFDRILADEIEDRLWRRFPQHMNNYYPPILPQLIQAGISEARQQGLREEDILEFVYRQFGEPSQTGI